MYMYKVIQSMYLFIYIYMFNHLQKSVSVLCLIQKVIFEYICIERETETERDDNEEVVHTSQSSKTRALASDLV